MPFPALAVRPDRGALDLGAVVALFAAFLGALTTTLIKRLSATEEALTISFISASSHRY